MEVILFASLLWVSTSSVITANEICLSCRDVVRPRDCDYIQICGPDEACYVDQTINTLGYIRYNVGCRDKQQCGVPTSVRKRALTLCNECCTGQLCNNAGCTSKGFGHSSTRGPICFNCPQQLYEHGCSSISICGQDEVCKLSIESLALSHDKVYKTSCELRQTCENAMNQLNIAMVERKRTNQIYKDSNNDCALQCCDTDLCNTGCNSSSTTNQVVTTAPIFITPTQQKHTPFIYKPTQPNFCLNNPCVHGICSLYQNTYACSCDKGYYGRNCSQVQDNCLLQNPCLQGTCHIDVTTSAGYTCRCIYGYQGTNCDQLIDHCASITCQHGGHCKNSAGGATCMCTSGYTGNHCEILIDHCQSITCQHGGQCNNSAGGASCLCPYGTSGSRCQTVNGAWSPWGAWVTCSVTCGTGTETRQRYCTHPAPSHGGHHCHGKDSNSRHCHLRLCPVDGQWSAWSTWSTCTVTCGDGVHSRHRSCNNPAPSHGGHSCSGRNSNNRHCNHARCPQDKVHDFMSLLF